MGTDELIQAIEALPLEKQEEAETFVHALSQDFMAQVSFWKAAESVFAKQAKLLSEQVLRLHENSLRLFGGSPGIRDRGLLGGNVIQPRNNYFYGGADLF